MSYENPYFGYNFGAYLYMCFQHVYTKIEVDVEFIFKCLHKWLN